MIEVDRLCLSQGSFHLRDVSFTIPTGPMTMSRRKLATSVVLHEVRHLAQVAHAARAAGVESPGDHDLLFCPSYD